jgi:hypothetical protein
MATSKKPPQVWHTLRNPNSIFQVSSDGEHIIVPITTAPTELVGFAVVRISDLSPAFESLREAQEWVDKQKNPTQPNR